MSAAWLTSARLSRKGNFTDQAYHSMLHAARLKDRSATIEHARLLWKDGHHRKAIHTLEGAISANEAAPSASTSADTESLSFISGRGQHQNELTARVCLSTARADSYSGVLKWHRHTYYSRNGRTEQARPIRRPLSKDIGRPSNCTRGRIDQHQSQHTGDSCLTTGGKRRITTWGNITTRSWTPRRPNQWERRRKSSKLVGIIQFGSLH